MSTGARGSRGRAALSGVIALLLAPACGDEGGADEAGDETADESGEDESGDEDASGDGDGDGADDDEGDTDTGPDTGNEDPGPQGVFVAVGDGGRRASSTDALEWAEIVGSGVIDTNAEMGEEGILRSVAVGEGVVIAVGGGGTDWTGNSMIMRSTDGESWDEDLVGGMEELDLRKLDAVGYSEGVFIAAGHQSHILRSDDAGLSWARVYPEHHSRTTVFGVAGHGGVFVLVGLHQDDWDQPKVAYVHRSADAGQSFEAPSYFGVEGDQLSSVASNGEVFVALGPNSCLRSADEGASWDSCGISGAGFGSVSFTRERFIVTYLDGVSTSEDGESWSEHVESPTGVPAEIVYGNGVYAGVRFYDRGVSEALGEWAFVTHGNFPLRDLAFLPLE